jgi:hypothetical protein
MRFVPLYLAMVLAGCAGKPLAPSEQHLGRTLAGEPRAAIKETPAKVQDDIPASSAQWPEARDIFGGGQPGRDFRAVVRHGA